MTLGSDATGDLYYRSAGGILTRLPVGSGTQFRGVSGGLPAWATVPISTGVSGLGTGVATALGVNVGSAGAFVTFGGALVSPSSVGTLPAHTPGGTISGGGNQLNNV